MSEAPRTRTYGPVVAAGLGAVLVTAAGLRWLRPRERTLKPPDEELRRIGDELAGIRSELSAGPVLRELLETFAAELEHLNQEVEQVYEESFVDTATGGAFIRLREFDRELVELTAEIRCRLAQA